MKEFPPDYFDDVAAHYGEGLSRTTVFAARPLKRRPPHEIIAEVYERRVLLGRSPVPVRCVLGHLQQHGEVIPLEVVPLVAAWERGQLLGRCPACKADARIHDVAIEDRVRWIGACARCAADVQDSEAISQKRLAELGVVASASLLLASQGHPKPPEVQAAIMRFQPAIVAVWSGMVEMRHCWMTRQLFGAGNDEVAMIANDTVQDAEFDTIFCYDGATVLGPTGEHLFDVEHAPGGHSILRGPAGRHATIGASGIVGPDGAPTWAWDVPPPLIIAVGLAAGFLAVRPG